MVAVLHGRLAVHAAEPNLELRILQHLLAEKSTMLTFRRTIRPVVLALLRALPSPEGCGCAARKRWLIAQIQAI